MCRDSCTGSFSLRSLCMLPAPPSVGLQVFLTSRMLQAVAAQLMKRGRQTLPEIIRFCDHSPALVRQAMLVLLQHNHAAAYTVKPESDALVVRPPYCVYQSDLPRTLSSLRQPRMLFHIR